MSEYEDGYNAALREIKEKKAKANKRYHSTPEGKARKNAAIKRYQLRKRIEELERRISKEGIEEYKQSVREKIEQVKEKLQGVEYKQWW